MDKLRVIAFDADDTLWVNEPFFREAEDVFCGLLEDYLPHHTVNRELYATEIANLPLYGYGIKAFALSMVETIIRVTDGRAPLSVVERAINIAKEMLDKPVELLEGVEETLEYLGARYRLVLATKGDLLDQERKLERSGLARHFHHIEVMSDKGEENYRKLIAHLDCRPEEFLMIGNSVKSDILPVLKLGGFAVHVPFHTTWVHEVVKEPVEHDRLLRCDTLGELKGLLPG
ncbi:putative hydrolase of the HAD superfamily [Lewinella marina]|uniref:HAD family hydrolase n=1 Tax=Neolewinella marina TaxID=438751 RepID=A0A2G0CJH9_9BACT|nr:HAD family hydrolase [Neolewinella marina]NJB84705.1 putative hydrolase of the HAD superfamily [Neolewinella marina]PHL00129.1 HAD family hydrolase [Neolewinella marina]